MNDDQYIKLLKESFDRMGDIEQMTPDYTPHIATAIGALGTIATIYKVASAAYKMLYSKAAKACKDHPLGRKRAICMAKYRKDAIGKQIESLKNNISMCSKAKDPSKCKREIIEKVKELQKKRSHIS